MIKTEHGVTSVKGLFVEIMADYHIITKSIKNIMMGNGMTEEAADKRLREELEEALVDEEPDDVSEKDMEAIISYLEGKYETDSGKLIN